MSVAAEDPLVFDTYYRPQPWGGRALQDKLGHPLPEQGPYGEAWCLSPQPLHVSRVVDGLHLGRDLNHLWAGGHLSNRRTSSDGFPLLVKWLECREFLSLQVHPDDKMAQRVLNEPFGKTEAWIVLSVEPETLIYAGLKPGVTRADVEKHLHDGTLADCLHSFRPQVGDCVFLPAGTVHAAGGGLVFAEVQQSSDATFRLFDWNRLGLDGKPRLLHIDRALEATNWDQGPVFPVKRQELDSTSAEVTGELLVDGFAFRLERYTVTGSFEVPHQGEMTIWMVLGGRGCLCNPMTGYQRSFSKGMTTVVPSSSSGLNWNSTDGDQLTLLCSRLPTSVTQD